MSQLESLNLVISTPYGGIDLNASMQQVMKFVELRANAGFPKTSLNVTIHVRELSKLDEASLDCRIEEWEVL